MQADQEPPEASNSFQSNVYTDEQWRNLSPRLSRMLYRLSTMVIAALVLLEHRYLGILAWVLILPGIFLSVHFLVRFVSDMGLFYSQPSDVADSLRRCLEKSTMYSDYNANLPFRLTLIIFLVLFPLWSGFSPPWGVVAFLIILTVYGHYAIYRPVAVVFFGASSEQSLDILSVVETASSPFRTVSLLRIGSFKRTIGKGQVLGTSRFRFRPEYVDDWQTAARDMIHAAKLVVIDARAATPLVVYEAALALAPEFRHKTLIISSADGGHPVLDTVIAAGPAVSVPMHQVVPEEDVGPRVKSYLNELMSHSIQEWRSQLSDDERKKRTDWPDE